MRNAALATTLFAIVVRSVVLLVVLLPATAAAQEQRGPAVEISAGWLGFADDGVVNEGMVGGAGRWYLTTRVSVGPEVVYISGDNHSHLALTGNLTYDVLSPVSGRPRRITPFLVAGGGLFQTRETFFNDDFTSSEGAFTAGGGVRAHASDRVIVGIDTRIGWELHIRFNGFIGFQLGR